MIEKNFILMLKKYQIQLGSVIMILFLSILIIKMLIPNFIKSSQLRENNRNLTAKISILRQKDEQLSTISEDDYKIVIPKIVKVMPSSKDYVSLFTTFDELQSKTGVAILRTDFQLGNLTVNPTNPKDESIRGGISSVPVRIDILGDIERISQFLESLADLSGRLILVESVHLEVDEDSMIKASISGHAYYNPQPFAIGLIESPLPRLTDGGDKILSQINQAPVDTFDTGDISDIDIGNNTLFY